MNDGIQKQADIFNAELERAAARPRRGFAARTGEQNKSYKVSAVSQPPSAKT